MYIKVWLHDYNNTRLKKAFTNVKRKEKKQELCKCQQERKIRAGQNDKNVKKLELDYVHKRGTQTAPSTAVYPICQTEILCY